jgi:hypothetical protein
MSLDASKGWERRRWLASRGKIREQFSRRFRDFPDGSLEGILRKRRNRGNPAHLADELASGGLHLDGCRRRL